MRHILYLSSFFVFTLLVACSEDESPSATGRSEAFELASINGNGVQGSVSFIERTDNVVQIDITISGTQQGDSHPAHIHFESVAEGGDIAISLNPIVGSSGTSTTEVTALENGAPVTYQELINYDGHLNIHLSESDLGTLISQGDVGGNALTGQRESYALAEVDFPGTSGTVTFSERRNGLALATVQIQNDLPGTSHPTHLHLGAVGDGDVAKGLNRTDGDTGLGFTHMEALNDGSSISYGDLLVFDGFVRVHWGPGDDSLKLYIAQGNIGSNAN
ncbi:MAG: hypothetical protein ACR2MX_11270 [Cyclobacteriaceae bacterium]